MGRWAHKGGLVDKETMMDMYNHVIFLLPLTTSTWADDKHALSFVSCRQHFTPVKSRAVAKMAKKFRKSVTTRSNEVKDYITIYMYQLGVGLLIDM